MVSESTSIIAELVLSPKTDSNSISGPLKDALELLRNNPNISIETHAMGTNINAPSLDVLFDAVQEVHNFLIEEGYTRVVTTLKIDERRDKPDRKMEDKINAVT